MNAYSMHSAGSNLRRSESLFLRLKKNLQALETAVYSGNKNVKNYLDHRALNLAKDAVYTSNLLSGELSELIRKYAPPEFQYGQLSCTELNETNAISVTEKAVLMRVPLAPYSVQRNAQRRRAAGKNGPAFNEYYARRRYNEVESMLASVQPVRLTGRKLMYLLHVYPSLSQYRASPDFDNYDVKDLIDAVMAHYGGDNCSNLAVLHDSIYSTKLISATYIAVTELHGTASAEELMTDFQSEFEALCQKNQK